MAWIEVVPNVSEGRRTDVLDECAGSISRTGAALLDVHRDPDHNRSVFTFAGTAETVVDAAHALVETAIARIDLTAHDGVHPRVGAVDVIPFVPLAGSTLETCVALARRFAAALADRHGVPVYLYEAAAVLPHRRRLEAIRKGGLAVLAARMQDVDWQPDFGPARPHPTAGVSIVGARLPLIAFNVDLATDRLDIAAAIARTIRESSGGLPAVKAIGLPLADRGIVQVSMNLTDFRQTSIRTAYDAVCREAARYQVDVIDSELVGLAPAAALTPDEARDMRIRHFDGSPILETRVARHLGMPGDPPGTLNN